MTKIDIYKLELKTSDTSPCLTLSNTKRGMDLGTLVVLFDQTFHPLHVFNGDIWIKGNSLFQVEHQKLAP